MRAPEPLIARTLLRLIVRGEDAEFLLGDIAEDYADLVQRSGAAAARRWYRRQAASAAARWLSGRALRAAGAWRRDIRHAVRSLARSPVYAPVTAVTLALGLGGAAAVLATAESLLRPLPFPNADRLVAVWETREGQQRFVAPANYLDWRRTSQAFESLAAHDMRSASVTVEGAASRERVADVSGNFFEALGLDAAVGRTFDPALNTAYGNREIVLSHGAWVARFGADPSVVGRTVRVEDLTYEVVGVLAPGAEFPEDDLFGWLRSPTEAPELRGFSGDLTAMRDAWYFRVVGRLAGGWELEAARQEMGALAGHLARLHPDTNRDAGVLVRPLLEETVGDFRDTLAAILLAVALVLLAAGVNVTHLALARAADRRQEVALKASLGARRGDLRRPFLIEGALLGLGGALLGLVLARWALAAGVAELGSALPRAGEVGLRLPVAAAAVVTGGLLGVLVGTVCHRRTLSGLGGAGASGARAVRGGGASGADGLRGRVASGARAIPGGAVGRGGFIAAQVAAAIALVAATALLGRSVYALTRVELGFDADRVATLRIALPDARALPYEERIATYRQVVEAVAALPGVSAAGLGSDSPLSMGPRAGVFLAGEARPDDPPDSGWQPVDTGYFAALGMPVRRGRGFESMDRAGSMDVAVVNEAFARTVLPGRDPLGVRVTMGLDGHDRPLTIVGVVADTRTRGPASPAGPVLYRPVDQTLRFGATSALVVLRTDGDPLAALARARDAARRLRPDLPVYAEVTGTELARPFRRTQSALLSVLAVFAGTALLLGVVGVYGVAAHSVRRRRREIGVRMALGANRRRVTTDVLATGMRPALLGVPVGLALTVLLGRALGGVLHGVPAADPVTLLGATTFVLVVTAAALFLPARSAAGVDPAEATREG